MPIPLKLPVNKRPIWDWSGAQPNLRAHQSFIVRMPSELNIQFQFTEAHISGILEVLMKEDKKTYEDLSFMSKICHNRYAINHGWLPILN
jgi:hypothetical protein